MLLIAEATKRGMRPKAPLTKLIEEAASPEAKELVGIVETAQGKRGLYEAEAALP
jgi:hypothetical protein